MVSDDTAEIQKPTGTVILTEVPSGTTCRLVSVVRRHHRMSRHHRGGIRRLMRHPDDVGPTSSIQIHGGGRRIMRRLLDLGITRGCSFEVIHGSTSGPVLVQVRGTRVALGQGLASRMIVEVVKQ